MAEITFRLGDLRKYLWRVVAFELVVLGIIAALSPRLIPIIGHNPILNIVIITVLAIGMTYGLLLTWRAVKVSEWMNAQHPLSGPFEGAPRLLSATSNLLRQNPSAAMDRTLLDSLDVRLDEQRESLRYMMGLLIFLGLLGTFWGLLQTVGAVGDAIGSVGLASATPADAFERMRSGLQGPMQGMGMAFSASLLGLSSSLVLGFINLQVGQAQNRFHADFEEWLSLRSSGYRATIPEDDGLAPQLEAALSRLDMLERSLATQAARLSDAPRSESLVPFAQDLTNMVDAVQQVHARMMGEALDRLNSIETLVAARQARSSNEMLSEALMRAAQHLNTEETVVPLAAEKGVRANG